MEGSKRRLSSKRSTRKQLGSSPTASCYSADYEVTEVLHFQGRPHLPSPFQLFAVQLPFQGRLPRSERGFSVAMWICLNSPILGNGVDDVFKHTSEDSQRQLGNSMERTMLSRRERIVHLCSVGSGKSLFEIWTFPSDKAVLIRYVWVIRECQRGKTDRKKNESINQLRNYHNNCWRQKKGEQRRLLHGRLCVWTAVNGGEDSLVRVQTV